jgi:hypothetical protein
MEHLREGGEHYYKAKKTLNKTPEKAKLILLQTKVIVISTLYQGPHQQDSNHVIDRSLSFNPFSIKF